MLLPLSITRQTFILVNVDGNEVTPVPTVTYDPVARVVTVIPGATSLDVGQAYTLVIETPTSPTDVNGLRTIDGATLAAGRPSLVTFTAAPASGTTQSPPIVDFCQDVAPVLTSASRCVACHSAGLAFAGLRLDTALDIQNTALGQVAHGSNSGPTSRPEPPGLLFNEDVPLIDPGPGPAVGLGAITDASAPDGAPLPPAAAGDPAHSWLLYKVLMAFPPACDVDPSAGYAPCDGGALPGDAGPSPTSIAGLYEVVCSDAGAPCPQALAADERARLSNLVPGREMPYPPSPDAPLADNPQALTLPELELLSLWIAQGAPMTPTCP